MLKLKMTNAQRESIAGISFISIWILGFLVFVFRPLVMSFIYSFNDLKPNKGGGGWQLVARGMDHFERALLKDPTFIQQGWAALQNVLITIPVIVFFSLFMAIVLNQKFKGRTIARSIFFMPVLITSGVLIKMLTKTIGRGEVDENTLEVFNAAIQQFDIITNFIVKMGTDLKLKIGDFNVIKAFLGVINASFTIVSKSGVQILLFLAALQSIPDSLYEAARVEGSTAWETFWKITFPMIMPIAFVNVVYSIVDSFTDSNNTLMNYIVSTNLVGQLDFGYASALAWLYFIVIVIVIALAKLLFYRNTSALDEI